MSDYHRNYAAQADHRIVELNEALAKSKNECNAWKQKHDHAFGELRREHERSKELESHLTAERERNRELERPDTLEDWLDSLPCDEKAAVCIADAWNYQQARIEELYAALQATEQEVSDGREG